MKKKEIISGLFIILIFKILSFYVIINNTVPEDNTYGIGLRYGDTRGYYEPMENLILHGKYESIDGSDLRTRMPYNAIPYFVFRQFLPPQQSFNAIVFLQMLLEVLSSLMLALLAFRLTKNKSIYWLVLFLISFSWAISVYANMLLSESLSISIFIAFLYFLFEFDESKKQLQFWLAAFCFAYVVLLKPYFGPVYAIMAIYFLFNEIAKKNKTIKTVFWVSAEKTILFFIPFVILLLPWAIYNSQKEGKFSPFYNNKIDEYYVAQRAFIWAVGGSDIYWDKKLAGSFFTANYDSTQFKIPSYFIADSYTIEDLNNLRQDCISYKKNPDQNKLN
ncbi:MAG: phospholipid carrier-dependent glycosyltransferase, partial [Cyclobacteriaceae bacterium]